MSLNHFIFGSIRYQYPRNSRIASPKRKLPCAHCNGIREGPTERLIKENTAVRRFQSSEQTPLLAHTFEIRTRLPRNSSSRIDSFLRIPSPRPGTAVRTDPSAEMAQANPVSIRDLCACVDRRFRRNSAPRVHHVEQYHFSRRVSHTQSSSRSMLSRCCSLKLLNPLLHNLGTLCSDTSFPL